MINIDEVKKTLAVMAQVDDDDVEEYINIIKSAISTISNLISTEHHTDDRAIYLASAKAYYDLSLTSGFSDDVTSFSAGDIKITQQSKRSHAKELLDSAMADAHNLICDNGFAFLGV